MASTARAEEEKVQYFDSPEVLQQKANQVAELIAKSKHFIAFTGAGISTSCGIPDFRSGMNTVLKTGAGVWQKRAQGVNEKQVNPNIVDRNKAIPSFTHMSLVSLEKAKILKFLVSQNTDGLHLRSGFNPFNLAQLHGNRMLEKCKVCQSRFLRDFITREAKKALQHQTSRKCEKCGNTLYDSIINFGQTLPEYEINRSFQEAEKADLCLAMGSSLTVNPAAHIPREVSKHGKLIIVNLQKTPLDEFAHIRVNSMCDNFMKLVIQKLQVKVDNFILQRLLQFKINKDKRIQMRGIDRRGIPFTYLKQASICYKEDETYSNLGNKQPYLIRLDQGTFDLKLQFNGWLKQPPVQMRLNQKAEGVMQLLFDPFETVWSQPMWIENFNYEK